MKNARSASRRNWRLSASEEEQAEDNRRRQNSGLAFDPLYNISQRRQHGLDQLKNRLERWASALELRENRLLGLENRSKVSFADQSVYVIGTLMGPVKIGIAKSPECRLKGFQTAYPYKLRLFYEACILQGKAYEIEQQAHDFFNSKRLQGEWFEISAERAVGAVKEMVERRFRGLGVEH